MAQWIEPSVTYTVEVAFASDPWATTPSFTDVSAYVRNVEVFRGAQSETLRFAPGRCSVTFSNADRRFDPDYAAGPYFGTILPMKRIRVTATRSAVTFTVFLGWVTGWVQDWQVGDGVAYAQCVDGGYFVESESLAGSAYESEVLTDAPVALVPFGSSADIRDVVTGSALGVFDSSNWESVTSYPQPDSESSFDAPAPLGVEVAWTTTRSAAAIITAPDVRAIEGWWTIPASGLAYLWLYAEGTDGADTPYIYVEYDDGTVSYAYSSPTDNRNVSFFGPPLPTGRTFHIAMRADTTNLYIYIDGQLAVTQALSVGTVAGGGLGRVIAVAQSFDVDGVPAGVAGLAAFGTAPSAARILDHYLAGAYAFGNPYGERGGERITRVLDEISYPSNLRDISTGGMIQGPYLPDGLRAMEYIDQVLASEQGLLFFAVDGKLTFRDRAWQWITADADGVVFSDDAAGGSIGYTEGSPNSGTIDTVRNIVTVSYSDVGGITNRDATSVTAYGPSQEFIDGPTIRNGTDASNLGKYVLRLKKDPKSIIPSLLVRLRSNIATNFAPVLGLELGEVVTVERTPMGVGSQIVRRHQITGIQHRITPDNWETRFYLSPAVPMADEVPYFTIAHATYGRVGAPAGNKIPG